MDPEPLHKSIGIRRAAVGAAALAIGVVGVVWLASEDERPAARVEATLPSPDLEAQRAVLAPASIANAAEADVRAESPGEMQMCGGAWIKLKNDGDVDWDSVGSATNESVQALSASVLGAMASSAEERVRGAASVLSMHSLTLAGKKLSECERDAACKQDAALVARQLSEQRDALARLAQGSNDPTVYGWAVRACKDASRESPGQCQVIHPAQWALLDPTNAAPWMAVAARAQAEKDEAALDDALYRISVAERYDAEEYKLGSIVLDHAPDTEENLWGTRSLVFEGLGIGALQIFEARTLQTLCAAKELAGDEVRRDACERSAEMLVKGSTSRSGSLIGIVIGGQVGWPEERSERLGRENDALQLAGTRPTPEGAAPLGCADIRGQLKRIRELAAEGEVAVLRRRLAEDSARTVASTLVRSFGSGAVPPR